MFRSPVTLFRALAVAEVVSWTLLIAGLIVRAATGWAPAVTIGGGIHGFGLRRRGWRCGPGRHRCLHFGCVPLGLDLVAVHRIVSDRLVHAQFHLPLVKGAGGFEIHLGKG